MHARLIEMPVAAFAASGAETFALDACGDGRFAARGVELTAEPRGDGLRLRVASSVPLGRLRLRFAGRFEGETRILGDHWERGYGDLEWRGVAAQRVLPWSFLAHDGRRAAGAGVRCRAGAMCFWTVDPRGMTLWLDTRSGGVDVEPAGRAIDLATIVSVDPDDRDAHEAARDLCARMCPDPRLPATPVYGVNDWYYCYGRNSRAQTLADAERAADLAGAHPNRPYAVIDGGWSPEAEANGSLWDRGHDRFGDMADLAARIASVGCVPGLWVRPLALPARGMDGWVLRTTSDGQRILDPTIPDAAEHVVATLRRLVGWGYRLIKHDFSTFDLLHRWGFQMGHTLTDAGWAFADRTRTTAEIIGDFYRRVREGCGDACVIGCNTVGHLAAGLVELQRTGDDTSGRQWERTRLMGVNTLAMRAAQQGTFFAADADCVGLTDAIPWSMNGQWLDAVARSGTPLFVSADPAAVGAEQEAALRRAFSLAAEPRQPLRALDWMQTPCPRRYRFADGEAEYDWSGDGGVESFA